MTTTTIPADLMSLSEREAKVLRDWVTLDVEDACGLVEEPDGRANLRLLIDLMDGADAGHVAAAHVKAYALTITDRRESYEAMVRRDEQDLAFLIETGDTSGHWPDRSLADNVLTQRRNLGNSRSYLDELEIVEGIVRRAQVIR